MAHLRFPRRRTVIRALVVVIVAGAAAGTVVGIRELQPEEEIAIEASVLRSAAVETGNVSVDESVDGSVVLTATTTVRHRIEGQLSSSSASTSSASSPQAASAPISGPNVASIRTEALDEPCVVPDTTLPDTTLPDTTLPDSTVPDTTLPDTTVPDTNQTTETPTTTIDPGTTTAPADTTSTSTTTTAAPPDTTAPSAPSTSDPATTCSDTSASTTSTPEPVMPTGSRPSGGTGGAVPTGAATSSDGGSTGSSARVTQKVTSMIATGTAVGLGDVLYTVDGTPVVVLEGTLPAWRTLAADVDDAADVAQLEASLVALGYDPDATVTVDQQWDDATTAMVEAWQTGLGLEPTGEVALGSVVFLPTSATVDSVTATVGQDVGEGDTILTLAAPTQAVVIDVPAELQPVVVAGLTVDLGETTGVVSQVHTVDRDGTVVVQAVITPNAALVDQANGSAITVDIGLDSTADDVSSLLVPVEALASRLDGSYAVEVDHGDGTTSWVGVTLVAVDGVTVAIRSSELAAGDEVLLPV